MDFLPSVLYVMQKNRTYGMGTRADILTNLRREALTIRELADRLGVARNAVVLSLQQLSSDGLVAGRPRKEKRAGKPALEYAVVAGREDVASLAYPSFAEVLVDTLPEHLTADQLMQLMHSVGRKMAAGLDVEQGQQFAQRLERAIDFVNALGAEATVTATAQGVLVQSFSCPLARAVRRQPCVCEAMASFFADATGADVVQRCDRGDKLICQFDIAA